MLCQYRLIALDQYCFQVPDQYSLPTSSRVIIRGLASTVPVPTDSTGPVLADNSQPNYNLETSQYYDSMHADIAPVPEIRRWYWHGTAPVVHFHMSPYEKERKMSQFLH